MTGINYGKGRTVRVGQAYTGVNGVTFTVEEIVPGDRFGPDHVFYRLEDGRTGSTPPNSMFHWIDWSVA